MVDLNTLPRAADEAAVVTKAVLRAAERLALPNRVLAGIARFVGSHHLPNGLGDLSAHAR